MYRYRIERLKDILLSFLIILSILLSVRLWYGLSLHNLFLFIQSNEIIESPKISDTGIKPQKIALKLGDGSVNILNISSEDNKYDTIYSSYKNGVMQVLNSQNNNEKIINYSKKKWLGLFNQPCLDIKYSCNIDYKIFKGIYKLNNIKNKPSGVKEVVLVPNAFNNNVICYVYDENLEKIYSFQDYVEDSSLSKYIKNIKAGDYASYTFEDIENIKDEIFIPTNYRSIKAYGVKMSNQFSINSDADMENLKKAYFTNPVVVRSFVDNQGVRTLFDNEAALRIYKEGYLEYNYLESTAGKDQGTLDAYKKAIAFLNKQTKELRLPKDTYLAKLENKGNGKYLIAFDYSACGLIINVPNGYSTKHDIEIEVTNGIVTACRRFIKEVVPYSNKKYKVNVDPLDAVDYAVQIARNKGYKVSIENVDLCYLLNQKQKKEYFTPYWCVEISDRKYYRPAIKGE